MSTQKVVIDSEYYDDTPRDQAVDDVLAGSREMAVYRPQAGSFGSGLAELIPIVEDRKRDPSELLRSARRIGGQLGLKALYRWQQGGKEIEGPTVDLIEDLAGEYRYLSVSTVIDEETDTYVRCTGVVVDLLTVSLHKRPYTFTITPPPARFAKDPVQRDRWHTMQLQSGVSKAIRTALEHALPSWYVAAAVAAAKQSAASGALTRKVNGSMVDLTLEQAIDLDVAHWGGLGVPVGRVELRLDRPRALWTALDLADLRTIAISVHRGLSAVDVEFPAVDGLPDVSPKKSAGLASKRKEDPAAKELRELRERLTTWEAGQPSEIDQVRAAAGLGSDPVGDMPLEECRRYAAASLVSP